MARRLFLAIPLPKNVIAEVADFERGLANNCGRARWTKPENLHVTVLFLGDVTDADFEKLCPRFEDAFAHAHPLELTVTGAVAGPPRRPPTMLWLHFKPSVGFRAVSAAALKAVEEAVVGLRPQRGEAVPHVTLARFRDGVPAPCQKQAESIRYMRTFTADSVKLFASELLPDGPVYRELRSFVLGA